MSTAWHLGSWRDREIRQVPEYADATHLERVEETLRASPPLVFAGEARTLRSHLARVAQGDAVL